MPCTPQRIFPALQSLLLPSAATLGQATPRALAAASVCSPVCGPHRARSTTPPRTRTVEPAYSTLSGPAGTYPPAASPPSPAYSPIPGGGKDQGRYPLRQMMRNLTGKVVGRITPERRREGGGMYDGHGQAVSPGAVGGWGAPGHRRAVSPAAAAGTVGGEQAWIWGLGGALCGGVEKYGREGGCEVTCVCAWALMQHRWGSSEVHVADLYLPAFMLPHSSLPVSTDAYHVEIPAAVGPCC